MPSQEVSGAATRVTTRPGASGMPRWSCEPCQKRRFQPARRATRLARKAMAGRQMSDPYPKIQTPAITGEAVLKAVGRRSS